ncbi:hypothetical protein CO058_01895 [candidate division WWE3 bacterium CG_4_9_14_0_2_um_filter_35_11]|uniref:Histidine phosphatase family protein n=1 Tax=candidate division WWE3 bacterium CG_4_9_14_0_2_um_filter_35_11 TaxID=1975077 RepID=A0A2M8ELX0_UNCKA|nr:MAG: hypothetical protein CO058_01895 [candidate division WWE3 bacterium CG_4_9_14_0_2_um_filter_35_11]
MLPIGMGYYILFSMTRIYLIRHADAYDEEGVQLNDYHLNNFGKVQALQLAKRLSGNKFDVMYCSKIKRAIETCEIVNEQHDNEVVYSSKFNEVGSEDWPQPTVITKPKILADYKVTSDRIYQIFKQVINEDKDKEVAIFTHGNWIRVLLVKIVANGNHEAFAHFMVSNSSLTIIDVDSGGFEHIVTVSDGAHTHLYETKI